MFPEIFVVEFFVTKTEKRKVATYSITSAKSENFSGLYYLLSSILTPLVLKYLIAYTQMNPETILLPIKEIKQDPPELLKSVSTCQQI